VDKAEELIVSMILKVTIMDPKIIFPVHTFATQDAALTKVQPKKDNIIFSDHIEFHLTMVHACVFSFFLGSLLGAKIISTK
jgi:hypothetical protein